MKKRTSAFGFIGFIGIIILAITLGCGLGASPEEKQKAHLKELVRQQSKINAEIQAAVEMVKKEKLVDQLYATETSETSKAPLKFPAPPATATTSGTARAK